MKDKIEELKSKVEKARIKIERLAEQNLQIANMLRSECIEYLTALLKMNGNSINWRDKDLPEYVTVTYDGGNHPEYASNAFSTVYGVMLDKNGEIAFDIEDCSQYDSYISATELSDICLYINAYSEEIGIKV